MLGRGPELRRSQFRNAIQSARIQYSYGHGFDLNQLQIHRRRQHMSDQSNPFILYLHGFASGPSSVKAKFFEERLKDHNVDLCIPDLNYPDFQNMTITSQLELIEKLIQSNSGHRKVMIAGSSMGGLLAVMAADRFPVVSALVLMAPGFGLDKRIQDFLSPDEFDSWRVTGKANFYHYGAGKTLPLSFDFVKDIEKHNIASLMTRVPTIIFHGLKDATVPVAESINFRQSNPELVELYLLDDDHQLLSSLEEIWKSSVDFMRRQGIVAPMSTVT